MNVIKKIILKIYFLSEKTIRILKSFYIVCRYYKKCDVLADMMMESNKECIVVGSGPSLSKTISQKLYFFNGKKKVCVNDAVQTEYFTKIKPDYYIFADPAYWSKSLPVYLNNKYLKSKEIFVKKVNWKMIIFLPIGAQKWSYFIDLPNLNENISIKYFLTTTVDCNTLLQHLLYKNNLAMVPAQNVLICAIFLSLNMGFKKIYIVGADHSWHRNIYIDSHNILLLRDDKAADSTKTKSVPYRINPIESKICTMDEIFSVYSKTFKGYMDLEEYSKYIGSKIYNASEVSYIDAFERLKI